MRALFPDEINPLLCGDETKIRMNFTNNIRWLYIDLANIVTNDIMIQ